jgi:hypothetical protein
MCPPFSKLLTTHIRHNALVVSYSHGEYNGYTSNKKKFEFIALRGLEQSNTFVTDGYKFHNLIKYLDDDVFVYYYIFVKEYFTVDEIRDTKILEVISE